MSKLSTAEKIRFMKAGTMLKLDAIRRGEGKKALLTPNARKMYAGILAEANAKKYGIIEANKEIRKFRNSQKGLNEKYYKAKEELRKKLGIKGVDALGAVSPKIGFDTLAKKVASRYSGKAVAPKYQGEYGKRYSPAEAREVGNKVAAKVYRLQRGMKGADETPYFS